MRKIFVTCLLVAAVGGAAFALMGAGGDTPEKPTYTVELDNAFGLVSGADVKIAGVRAGTIKSLDIDPEDHRALVEFEITKDGFGSLRRDVFCETRPQSLIGEYFIDCIPGTDAQKLPQGARIPVEQTASTVPIDLVNNILREPYRERLRIILSELGIGVAGRASEINEVIRRASPALRETNKVLDQLGDQNQVLKELVTNADTVIGDLSDNRRDVVRWVKETRETAAASAERREDIAGALRRLPTFLRELRPTMAALGGAADAQTPSLRNLNAAAGQLTRFLENLKPFSESTQVNLRSLAEASRRGRPAVRAARPLISELASATDDAPELAGNLAIVLEHLDDRKFAVEKDPRSPGGQGYTGLEAFLQYPFDQALAINTFDKNGYILKVNLFESKCAAYQNAQSLKEEMEKDPNFYKDCASILGPNQPGVTTPDPTFTGRQYASADKGRSQAKQRGRGDDEPRRSVDRAATRDLENDARRGVDKDELRRRAVERLRDALREGTQNVGKLRKRLEERLGIELPPVKDLPQPPRDPRIPTPTFPSPGPAPAPAPAPQAPSASDPGATGPLLDYLFGP